MKKRISSSTEDSQTGSPSASTSSRKGAPASGLAAHGSGGQAPLPADNGGKVKLDLQGRTDSELLYYGKGHEKSMTGNPLFPDPTPGDPEFSALLERFKVALAEHGSAQAAAREATAKKNSVRKALENALRHRGYYVQNASNGNTPAILSSGLGVVRDRSPVGTLPFPAALQVTNAPDPSALLVKWESVPKNQGYIYRYAKDQPERVWSDPRRVTKTRLLLTDLEVGVGYVVEVATLGGNTGQSDWSPPVARVVG
jgi:hypothetical protein